MKTKVKKKKKQSLTPIIERNYIVKMVTETGKAGKLIFAKLAEARDRGFELMREGRFTSLENSKGILLPLK